MPGSCRAGETAGRHVVLFSNPALVTAEEKSLFEAHLEAMAAGNPLVGAMPLRPSATSHRSGAVRIGKLFIGLALTGAGIPGLLRAGDLQPATSQAWDDYIRSVDAHRRPDAARPFLWMDESPDRRLRVRRGEILVAPVVGHGTQNVPNGLIHDWIGAAFIPNATRESLLAVMRDYDRYKQFYKPVVADSKALRCDEADQEFSMVWRRRVLFVNAAMEGRYQAHRVAVDAQRGYIVAETTEVREFQGYGHSGERLLPPDTGSGYIWRLHSIASYEERDGGVYLELEAIALTRDIPASLQWMVGPVVNRLSMNSLTTTLRQTRDAVKSSGGRPEQISSFEKSGPAVTAVGTR
jgi:hypothetical protein